MWHAQRHPAIHVGAVPLEDLVRADGNIDDARWKRLLGRSIDYDTGGVDPRMVQSTDSRGADLDRDTGGVSIRRYVAVDDCGNILNPLIVDGQVHGGVAQGIGQALWEQAVYDDNGQLVTGEFMDYTMPRAHMMPWIESAHTITPTPVNPLGVKGVGEAGTIGASPAVVNSVVDALSPLGVRHLDMPLTPEKLWKVIAAGRNA